MQPISSGTAAAMIAVAIILDLLSIIPLLGTVTDMIAAMLFGIWFSHYGISLMTKRPLGFLGTILAEFIPLVDALPFWTVFIIMTIRKEQAEAAAEVPGQSA